MGKVRNAGLLGVQNGARARTQMTLGARRLRIVSGASALLGCAAVLCLTLVALGVFDARVGLCSAQAVTGPLYIPCDDVNEWPQFRNALVDRPGVGGRCYVVHFHLLGPDASAESTPNARVFHDRAWAQAFRDALDINSRMTCYDGRQSAGASPRTALALLLSVASCLFMVLPAATIHGRAASSHAATPGEPL